VVAYDDAGGTVAARLWWMLTVTGHEAAVLDGGIQAWTGALETGEGAAAAGGSGDGATFTPRPWPPEATVDADAIAAQPRRFLLLDARPPERYRGETEPVDPRAGHIPGAQNAPSAANLTHANGRFLPAADLRARYVALGVGERDDRPTVAYCGSGVTACHDLLALEIAGLEGLLYPGSWSEWSGDPNRPAELGD
jgi:thiosulfate/3-mercaptopyruvate sulfurtransferase